MTYEQMLGAITDDDMYMILEIITEPIVVRIRKCNGGYDWYCDLNIGGALQRNPYSTKLNRAATLTMMERFERCHAARWELRLFGATRQSTIPCRIYTE